MASPLNVNVNSKWKKRLVNSNHPLHNYKSNSNTIPIIFHPNYDINFYRLEKLHSFDCSKWGKAHNFLMEYLIKEKYQCNTIAPSRPITEKELTLVHSEAFVKNITTSHRAIAYAAEIPILIFLPVRVIRRKLLNPLLWQTAGSVLAGFVALKEGWSINIGGGFHHCSHDSAGGFCFFADIFLLIKYLWEYVDEKLKIMIVDLDAHQGNGHERDAINLSRAKRKDIFILDIFNASIYPNDYLALGEADISVPLKSYTKDDIYLGLLKSNLKSAIERFKADLIVYNAGTDVLEHDPLGSLSITKDGVILRDEFVFSTAKEHGINIVMLTSGGYQKNNAALISSSIKNLINKDIINVGKIDIKFKSKIKSKKLKKLFIIVNLLR